jgi:hypothetical protein
MSWKRLFGREEKVLVEGIHVDLFPDRMSPFEPGELDGQEFRLSGWWVRVIETTALSIKVRYLAFWETWNK